MRRLIWDESSLGRQHDRGSFTCGDPDLDAYFRRYARQNHESGGAKCFVATPRDEPAHVLGFYTLGPASIDFSRTPATVRKGLARYEVPVYRLGRLAVEQSMQSRGIGGTLLLGAAARSMRVAEEAGGVGLLIDAKNEAVARWYAGYGAVPLLDAPLTLVLPFAVVGDAVARARS